MDKLTPYQCQLATDNIKLAYYFAHKAHTRSKRFSYEDYQDACMTALMKAVRTFDPTRGIKFSSWMGITCNGEIYKVYRNSNLNRNKGETISLETQVASDKNKKIYLLDVVSGGDEINFESMYLQEGLSNLSERERKCIHLHYIVGMRQGDIGELLGVQQVQVSRIIRKGLAKMKEYYEQVG